MIAPGAIPPGARPSPGACPVALVTHPGGVSARTLARASAGREKSSSPLCVGDLRSSPGRADSRGQGIQCPAFGARRPKGAAPCQTGATARGSHCRSPCWNPPKTSGDGFPATGRRGLRQRRDGSATFLGALPQRRDGAATFFFCEEGRSRSVTREGSKTVSVLFHVSPAARKNRTDPFRSTPDVAGLHP